MRVTVLCDASFCPRYHVAGYGYWIASNRGKNGGSGQIARVVQDNNVAEAMAICNVIWHGIQKELIRNQDEILIQSDCLRGMDLLRISRLTKTPEELEVYEYFVRLKKDFQLECKFKHVKAHTPAEGKARLVANHMCDRQARQAMRRARQTFISKLESSNELHAKSS